MITRHTIVLTADLHGRVVDGATALVARVVASERGVLLLGQRIGDDPAHGEVTVPCGPHGLQLTTCTAAGTLPTASGPVNLGAARIVASSWPLLLAAGDDGPSPAVFDRQIRAFGAEGQSVLQALRVGIVGAGGTGSAVFEQLVRLGVGSILIIDPDVINDDSSNVTRVYGSSITDIGQPKVALAERNASRIGLGTDVVSIHGTINDEATARRLTDCDVVFGCTDDNRGRVTLGRIATWYLVPVIDVGVKLTSIGKTLRNIEGRVSTIEPGGGCLQCRGRIDAAALQAEVLHPGERARRVDEGYAAGLDEPDPAVVAFTTGVAAHAVAELIHRLFALDQQPPSAELLIRFHQRDIRRNTRTGHPGHWCVDPESVGAGDTQPFLGTTWTT